MLLRAWQAGRAFCLAACLCLLMAGNTGLAQASQYDLNGTYKGLFHDKGRNVRRTNFRLRIKHSGEQLSAEATDRTLWITGLVVENKVFVDWEHASGERGEGVWDILDDGDRLKGTWESKGSGRYFGDWDLTRQ